MKLGHTEQIARSRSITVRESSVEDPVPSVTDLNLSVPVDRQDSSEETPVRSNTSPKRSTTLLNSRHPQRSTSTQNLSTTTQAPRVKYSSSRNSTVAIITPATSNVTGINSNSKSNSNRRIAAILPNKN
jgi:hypothetical protein